MADIFLSYAKEDREVARKLATLLGDAGWTVWWDRRIPAGRTWRSVLEQALREMRCMVVLWSAHSIESDWVRDEADEARSRKKLVPVLIEPVKPPVGFRNIQAADLSDWDGSSTAPGVQQLIADLDSLIGKPIQKAQSETKEAQPASAGVVQSRTDRETEAEASSSLVKSGISAAASHGRYSRPALKIHLNSKLAIAGGSVVAVFLGLYLLWPNRWDQNSDKPPIQAEQVEKPAPVPHLVSIAVNADRKEIKANESLTLTLRGEYSDGTQDEIQDGIEWTSSEPGVARIDTGGRIKAIQPGTTKITGQHGGLVTPPWMLAVAAPATPAKPPALPSLVALRINAARKELTTNERMSLQLKGNYSDGTEKAVSQGVVWQSSDPAIASVNSEGEVRALRVGRVEVIARAGGLKSSPVYLIVKQPPTSLPAEASEQKAPGVPTVKVPPRTEQLTLQVAPYINRAKDYRVQGNYAAALAELHKAQGIDPSSSEVRKEIEQTKRACNAEKRLGRKELEC